MIPRPVAASEPDPPPLLGRRQRKAIATRCALLEAGLVAFETTPLALISVQDITDRADVAKGVFYLHFKSRDAFLLALWRDVQSRFLERAERAMNEKRSVRPKLEAFARAYAEMPVHQPREVIFWMRMSSYIVDEIGEPGTLLALRREYFDHLAKLAFGRSNRAARELIGTVDACCWGIIWHRLSMRLPPLEPAELARRVMPAIIPLLKRDTM